MEFKITYILQEIYKIKKYFNNVIQVYMFLKSFGTDLIQLTCTKYNNVKKSDSKAL